MKDLVDVVLPAKESFYLDRLLKLPRSEVSMVLSGFYNYQSDCAADLKVTLTEDALVIRAVQRDPPPAVDAEEAAIEEALAMADALRGGDYLGVERSLVTLADALRKERGSDE